MQRTDDQVGVRNGHVVFACDGRVRATVTASWYRQMGFPNVYAVDGGTNALDLRIGDAVPNKATPLVATCVNGRHTVLAGATLKDLGYQQVAVLSAGMPAWRQAGLPLEKGLSGVMSPPTDVLAMGTDRNWADAMHYLRWEEELGKKYATQHT